MNGPALTSQDRMAVGRARTKLRHALDQLDLALERGNRDTNEAAALARLDPKETP